MLVTLRYAKANEKHLQLAVSNLIICADQDFEYILMNNTQNLINDEVDEHAIIPLYINSFLLLLSQLFDTLVFFPYLCRS